MAYGSRVLIVEDDPTVRGMLVEYLGDKGFVVAAVDNGAAMREEIERELPDLILLDIHLPGEDGLSIARYLRERYDVAIIMVTGANDVIDRVVGLEVGADDYVPKPFDPRELLARIKSVLRRVQLPATGGAEPAPFAHTAQGAQEAQGAQAAPSGTTAEPRHRIGRCWLELQSHRLWADDGSEVPMTAMEYDLLRVFVANPNRVLSRDQLLMKTRNREWEPFDRSIDIRIGRLRRKVEAGSGEPRTIRTVRNGGYMFVPD